MHKRRRWSETDRVTVPRVSDKPSRHPVVPYHIWAIFLHRYPARFSLDDILPLMFPHGNVWSMSGHPICTDDSAPTINGVQSRACITFWRKILSRSKLLYESLMAMPFNNFKFYQWNYSLPQIAILYGLGVIP